MMNNKMKNKKSLILIELFLKSTPYMLSFSVYVILSILMFWGLSTIEDGIVSKNPLNLVNFNDWVLMGLLVLSTLIGGIYIFLTIKRKLRTFADYFGILLVILTCLSWVGILIIDDSSISIESVKRMEFTTYLFNGLAIVMSVIGVGACCFKTRKLFKKTNWWMLIVMIPYMVISYTAGQTIFGLKSIQNLDGYSAKSLASFLKVIGDANVNLANQSFYTIFTFMLFVCFFYVGGNISGIVYRKGKERCRYSIEKIKERHQGKG